MAARFPDGGWLAARNSVISQPGLRHFSFRIAEAISVPKPIGWKLVAVVIEIGPLLSTEYAGNNPPKVQSTLRIRRACLVGLEESIDVALPQILNFFNLLNSEYLDAMIECRPYGHSPYQLHELRSCTEGSNDVDRCTTVEQLLKLKSHISRRRVRAWHSINQLRDVIQLGERLRLIGAWIYRISGTFPCGVDPQPSGCVSCIHRGLFCSLRRRHSLFSLNVSTRLRNALHESDFSVEQLSRRQRGVREVEAPSELIGER